MYGATSQILTRVSTQEPWPRFRGHSVAADAAPPVTRCHVSPLSAVHPGFWIWAPDFKRFTLQSQ